jgi:argininosuccinate lyase
MNLWGGRFSQRLAPDAWDLNTSLKFDQRLGPQDIRGSQAWARALERASILSGDECAQICDGLEAIGKEFETQEFAFQESDEDIHTAVERRLGEIIGPLAGKLHTGRSRNDQVATDLRLWILEHLPNLEDAIDTLQGALVTRADKDMNVRMPGYTHLQRAQPILLSHWWLSHFWPLQRDRERLGELAQRVAQLPLGSGALAGTPYPIDRAALATDLGFEEASLNSIDAVSDRDFAAEFLFCAALTGLHLSKLAEAMVLFSSAEFGFFELSDAYATGSSLMPQKKNPDVFELTRAKAGTLIGYLTGLMTTLKGLPSTYDKDLQEDKVPVFSAFDTLTAVLPVLANALGTLTINPKRMEHGIDASMMATDLADYLVKKGIPFREAHEVVGKAVDALSQAEFQAIHPEFSPDVYGVFDPANSLSRRNSSGGTAPKAVEEQIQSAKETIGIN